ncbi:Uncharacterised protein [Vibrio cholerae]|nr:Uncharacterised protein [Vibrio cholerae]
MLFKSFHLTMSAVFTLNLLAIPLSVSPERTL